MSFTRFSMLGLRRTMQQTFKPHFAAQRQQWYNSFKQSFRFQSTQAPKAKQPMGLKKLVQEYGYSALGVYLLISAIDYPCCFLLVHSYGADKVAQYQTEAMNWIKEKTGLGTPKPVPVAGEKGSESEASQENTSFWDNPLVTEAIVAYALHKSLIFIRVPITAAVTPGVVGQLRRWGFNIGNQKMSTIAQHAKNKVTQGVVDKASAAANNPKFGRPASKGNKWTSWFF